MQGHGNYLLEHKLEEKDEIIRELQIKCESIKDYYRLERENIDMKNVFDVS